MVSAAHPLAVEAGLEMLRRGGHAVDAAISVQLVLGLVEAPETGIGGGGFLLLREADSGAVLFYDGRETAPAAAGPDRFTVLGQPMPGWLAVPGGRSVGVPGLVAMLALAHQEHGLLDWADLAEPAIRLAEQGVPAPRRLQAQLRADRSLRLFRDLREYFAAPLRSPAPRLQNPAYAATLRAIAAEGPRAFYAGEIAAAVVERAAAGPWPGDLSVADLRDYRALAREPVCGPYRQWTVCGAPPPSSGGIAVLQVLGMLERFPLGELAPGSAEAIHLLAEAQRLAFADRERYLGDPDFVAVPVAGLLDRDYLWQRSLLIDPSQALDRALPGRPTQSSAHMPGRASHGASRSGGTSHFTVADANGNVVALTSSIEAPFGARRMAAGFLLNNQLTDFSFRPEQDGLPHPNAVAPGKRPRSSMSPVIVLDAEGEVRLALGARGGPRIIAHVLKTLIAVLDWELEIQEAIALPNFVHLDGRLEVERGTPLDNRREAFRARGHRVRSIALPSGLHGIERWGEGWRGGADPRLDGIALGDPAQAVETRDVP